MSKKYRKLNDHYWECECDVAFIHNKADTLECKKCNCIEEECPDADVVGLLYDGDAFTYVWRADIDGGDKGLAEYQRTNDLTIDSWEDIPGRAQ